MADEKSYVDTHYIKNSQFQTFFSTGIFGGVTPNRFIDLNFYVDRGPIPKKITFEVDSESGNVTGELERDSKEGIIREVHCGVLIDVGLAKNMIEWLDEKIKQVEGTSTEKS